MAKKKEETGLLQLDPSLILADDNTRFNLQQSRISSLADSIIAQGGVMVPVEVEPIGVGVIVNGLPVGTDPSGKYKYRLTTGFYRHAAVSMLNSTQAAGLTLPALVHSTANSTDRLKRQLVENMERENQSPMDQAIAIKKLLDAGIPKMEVRQIFARPGRGKGNNKPTAASNSFINMILSFLDLPKKAQNGIHSGLIGVAAAYQLTKVPVDQRDAVLERIEAERQKAIEAEERAEEKLLADEKKQAELTDKASTLQEVLTKAEAEFQAAQAKLEAATVISTQAFAASKAKYDTAVERKIAATNLKLAEDARKIAASACDTAQKAYEKALKAHSTHAEVVANKAAKLKEAKAEKAAKAPAKSKDAKVDEKEIGKASKAETGTGKVVLNASEMRRYVSDLCLPGGNEDVRKIGMAFRAAFAGETTDKELYKDLVSIVLKSKGAAKTA